MAVELNENISGPVRAKIRSVLNTMRLMPEASAGSVAAGVSQGKPGTKPPPGLRLGDDVSHELGLAEEWEQRFAQCRTDREAEYSLEMARVALHAVQHRQEKGRRQLTPDEMTELILLLETWDSRHAAIFCGPTVREEAVRRTRIQHGRDPDTGVKVADVGDERDPRVAVARALRHGDGLSFRAIASRLGVGHTTVARWLGESAS